MNNASATTDRPTHPALEQAESARPFRVLFCCSSELDVTSGTPVIVCNLLDHFPPGQAEVVVEANIDHKQRRRRIELDHPIYKYRLHAWLWPFKRGHRVRRLLARIGMPVLAALLVRRIRRFRPDCLFAVYAQPHWILATWIASRLTGVPLIYHVHDAFLEATERRQRSRFCRWLERKTLTTARALALDDHMSEHYELRYGIRCTILRHIVRHEPLPVATHVAPTRDAGPNDAGQAPREIRIGFAGAIYDSNSRELADLCRLVAGDEKLRLSIWTGMSADDLARLGIGGIRVEIGFEADYDRLLANLRQCDLLYLPLQFYKGTVAVAGAMEFSMPTKSFDYLLSGAPILVHCPAGFSLSRFFTKFPCGHVLNDPSIEAVRQWFDAWRAKRVPALDDSVRRQTLAMYTPAENKRILWQVLGEEVERAKTAKAHR